jgi:hypothetical protein
MEHIHIKLKNILKNLIQAFAWNIYEIQITNSTHASAWEYMEYK